jgi:hypothetical protein
LCETTQTALQDFQKRTHRLIERAVVGPADPGVRPTEEYPYQETLSLVREFCELKP